MSLLSSYKNKGSCAAPFSRRQHSCSPGVVFPKVFHSSLDFLSSHCFGSPSLHFSMLALWIFSFLTASNISWLPVQISPHSWSANGLCALPLLAPGSQDHRLPPGHSRAPSSLHSRNEGPFAPQIFFETPCLVPKHPLSLPFLPGLPGVQVRVLLMLSCVPFLKRLARARGLQEEVPDSSVADLVFTRLVILPLGAIASWLQCFHSSGLSTSVLSQCWIKSSKI